MKSAIAILTYNRVDALKETLSGLRKLCPQYPTAIFEDCGQRDGTEAFLMGASREGTKRKDLLATRYDGKHIGENVEVFLGDVNLGVTGNSNRALKWFSETGCDHLCLMNDDLHVLGDFVNFYAQGHEDLGVGLFCFCDFVHHESYRWLTVNSRGHRVKLLGRMTGIMMSVTRQCFDTIGYYDARFGKFGEEHCDYTIRARIAGFVNLDGQKQNALDLESKPPVLKHQDCATSIFGPERTQADQEAATIMKFLCSRYGMDPVYRPFRLRLPKNVAGVGVGGAGLGIPMDNLGHYAFVDVPA